MPTLWLDLRFARRGLLRARYVAAVSILSIGLGVGAAVAAYSWMDGLVLHPFPAVADQTRLVGIEVGPPNGGMGAWSYRSYQDLGDAVRSLAGVAAWRIVRASARHPGERGSTSLLVTTTSGNYFDVLGVKAVRGRVLDEADVRARARVVVLGYRFWSERYANGDSALGKTIFLNGEPFTIVGVAPPRFSGVYTGVVPQFYVPLTTEPVITGVNTLDDPRSRSWLLFARLAPGRSIEEARAETDAAARRISAGYGDRPATGADVMDLRVQFLGRTLAPIFTAMLAVATLLLLLASANVAGLLLVRSDERRSETALRLALGAPRRRIVQIVLMESGMLAALGSLAGVAGAYLARGLVYTFVPRGSFGLTLPVPIDWRVLGIALLGTVAVALTSGAGPALASLRAAPQRSLRAGARGLSAGASRLRTGIVAGQLALSTLLLVLAGMFARGLERASAVDIGFTDPGHVLLVDTNLRAAQVTDSAGPAMIDEMLARVRAIPGVEHATVASMVPLGFGGRRIVDVKVQGDAPAPNESMTAERAHVAGDYAATMRIRVVAGRDLSDADRASTLPVALVNEAFAARFLRGANPIGRQIDVGRGWATIVGVLHDGKYDRLDESRHPVVYVPISQFFVPGMTLHVRTRGDPMALTESVRLALRAVQVDLPSIQPRTLAEHISASTFAPRTGTRVLGALAAFALLLSAVGLYGALANAVTLRARELAIRLALGAGPARVNWVVVRSALTIAGVGIAGGAALALPGGAVLRAQVSSAGKADALVFALATVVLLAAALVAAWLPARRAVRLDPAAVLRGD